MQPISFLQLIIFLFDFSFYEDLFFSLNHLITFENSYYLLFTHFLAYQDYLKNSEGHFINFDKLLSAIQLIYNHLNFVIVVLTFVMILEDWLNEHSSLP